MTDRTLQAIALLALLAFLLISYGTAQAAPFVVGCVSSSAADKYVVTNASTPALNGEYNVTTDAVNCPQAGNRAVRVDMASVPGGVFSLSVALKSDLWGVLGAPVPFSDTRPTSSDLVVDGLVLRK